MGYSSLLGAISSAAVLFSGALAQTQAEIDAYPEMATHFAAHGLTWESKKVKTENGYTMTVFHITGSVENGPFEITRPSLVM